MRGNEHSLEELRTSIPNLQSRSLQLDLENVVNAVQGVGEVRVTGTDITIRYDPNYVSEKSLRLLITKAGYPQSDQSST